MVYIFAALNIVYICCTLYSLQTDAEYEEMYMTYRSIDHGNYTKVYQPSHYSGNLPDTVDWRTNNAVTGIKNQVNTLLSGCTYTSLPDCEKVLYVPSI